MSCMLGFKLKGMYTNALGIHNKMTKLDAQSVCSWIHLENDLELNTDSTQKGKKINMEECPEVG